MKQNRIWKVVSMVLAGVSLLALMTGAVAAQDINPPANSLTVDGYGQAYGTPDIAYLQLGVQITDSDVDAAFSQVNDTINQIISTLTEMGIDSKDLQTTGLYMYPQISYDPQTGEPTGNTTYMVSNSLTVTIHDVSRAGDIITAGVKAGANNIGSLSFGIEDKDALESEARVIAVADARNRAEQLADALGVELGNPTIIVESLGGSTPSPLAFRAESFAAGGSTPVEQGQLSVSVQVRITFSIS